MKMYRSVSLKEKLFHLSVQTINHMYTRHGFVFERRKPLFIVHIAPAWLGKLFHIDRCAFTTPPEVQKW